ncbi:MAG: Major transporter facilitator family protein [Candidatus Tokpelaia sp. JSC189]|nr:MAG: Major transporter facilitator family protein [Candidatus Tokpelaia sp. JSC189]
MRVAQPSDTGFIRRGLILVFITLLLDIIGIAIIIPVMFAFLSELTGDSISRASVDGGFLLMVYSTMQFIFAPLVGNLSDRFGRRPVLLVSILTFALDNLICALAASYWMLFAGRILAGVSGASFATCSAFIADISNDKTRTRNFGLIGIAFGIGFIFGPIVGGLLGHFGPRVPFYGATVLSFVNFIFSWFMLPETLSIKNRRCFSIRRANPLGAFSQMRKYPSVLWVSLAFFFYWMGEAVWPSVWPFVSTYRYGWNESLIGLSLGMFGVGQIVMMVLVLPRLTMLGWSDWRISVVGLTFAMIGLVGYAFASEGWMILVIFALTCMEYLAHVPMRAIAAGEVPPSAQGELQGALSSISSLTSMVGPIMYTWVFARSTDTNASVHFAGAPYLLAAVFIVASWLVMIFYVCPPGKIRKPRGRKFLKTRKILHIL